MDTWTYDVSLCIAAWCRHYQSGGDHHQWLQNQIRDPWLSKVAETSAPMESIFLRTRVRNVQVSIALSHLRGRSITA